METPSMNVILLELAQDIKELRHDVTVVKTQQVSVKEDIVEFKTWKAGLFAKGIALVTICMVVGQLLGALVLSAIKH
tara:strand:- start:996 stop:1226 length:231 start_codon:yes stop_codon:yes gene_type:complete